MEFNSEKLINRVRELRATRHDWDQVAEKINKEGFKTPRGLPWSRATINSYVLQNSEDLRSRRRSESFNLEGAPPQENPKTILLHVEAILKTKGVKPADKVHMIRKAVR